MLRRLEQWRQLPRGERWLLLRLFVLLPLVDVALRYLGISGTSRLLGLRRVKTSVPSVSSTSLAMAVRLGQLVDIASRHGPYGATCLRRSLVLCGLLRRRDLPAELRIGVCRVEHGVHAHAWVEVAGRIINDRPRIADDYTVYENLGRLPIEVVEVQAGG